MNNKKILSMVISFLFVFSLINVVQTAYNKKTLTVKNIAVKGVVCQDCVKKVTKALKKIKGVEKVEVSLQNGDTKVYLDSKIKVKNATLIKAIKGAGYSASIKK